VFYRYAQDNVFGERDDENRVDTFESSFNHALKMAR
jgi:hypothetical protein